MQEENLQLRELVGDVMSEVQATLTAMGLDQPELAEQLSNDVSQSQHISLIRELTPSSSV